MIFDIFRTSKYGDNDKIPRHKYGIYSKLWPREREKIINEARKKIQKTFTKSQLEQLSKQKRLLTNPDIDPSKQKKLLKMYDNDMNSHRTVSKLLSSIHGLNDTSTPENTRVLSVNPVGRNPFYSTSLVSNKSKGLYGNSLKSGSCKTDSAECIKNKYSSGLPNWKNIADYAKLRHVKENMAKSLLTQGDKLNKIKSIRYNNEIINKDSASKSKHSQKI